MALPAQLEHMLEKKFSELLATAQRNEKPTKDKIGRPVVPRLKSKQPVKSLSKEGKRSRNDDLAVQSPQLRPDSAVCPKWLASHYIRINLAAEDLYTCVLVQDTMITTNSAGKIDAVFGNAPLSYASWPYLANTFEEFRTLAMEVKFEPVSIHGGTASTVFAPWSTVIDRDSLTPLANYASAALFPSEKMTPAETPWTRVIYMSGVEDSGWLNSGDGNVNTFYLKTLTDGNTANLTIGRVISKIVVQLRGRGL